MHYYPFHIALFSLHASHLSLEEEAVYRRLLDYYYDTESPIPIETQSVIRRLRLGSYSDIVGSILSEFFILQDDGWHNLRADIEILDYNSKADTARKNGKKGGRPKKNKGLETQPVNLANPGLTHEKPNKNKNKNKELGISLKDLSANTDDPVDLAYCFDRFWDSGIKKTGKKKAKPLFARILKTNSKSDGPTIFDFTTFLITDIKKRLSSGQLGFAEMHPTTYLNGERWADEITNRENHNGQNRPPGRRESLAERSDRETNQILANIEAREAHSSSVEANEQLVRSQVGQPGRASHDGEWSVLDGLSVVVPEDGALDR